MIAVHCTNPSCSSKFSDTYYVDSLEAPCPACGERRTLVGLNVIHLIIPSFTGKLYSPIEQKSYKFMCSGAQKAHEHGIRHPGYPVWYSKLPEAVSCPACFKNYGLSLTDGDLLQGKLQCPHPEAGSPALMSGPTTA